MRFLFVNNHCISDPTAGVTQSLRTIMEWLADAGHACHILTTARFESRVTFTIEADRFLHRMVRFLVGTMTDIARHRRPVDDLAALLDQQDNQAASPPAPPEGLFLVSVQYPAESYA